MSHCYYHAVSSVKRWGGCVDDYRPLHDWFDPVPKAIIGWTPRATARCAPPCRKAIFPFARSAVRPDHHPQRWTALVPDRHCIVSKHARSSMHRNLRTTPALFADWARADPPPSPWMLR